MAQRSIIKMSGLGLPGLGAYVWEIRVDNQKLGEIPFYITQVETAPATT